jgi:triosephosphate isomerase
MLASIDVTHVIIGHSERRRAGENDESINQKMHATIKSGMTAIVCVGEWERDHAAHYLTFVEKQIRSAVGGISKAKLDRVVVAYEPVWAIGTGNTATPEDVHEMKLFIQKVLVDIYGRAAAQKVRILYGGSVNGNNAESLMRQGLVDGFLVGGASLSADEFKTIILQSRVL